MSSARDAEMTPGPWQVAVPPGRSWITTVYGTETVALVDKLADARLIAAAPEMLALLRNAVDSESNIVEAAVDSPYIAKWIAGVNTLLDHIDRKSK